MSALTEGLVDQLEDRRLCKAEALGSNPNKSTSRPIIVQYQARIAKDICTMNCQGLALIISQDEPLNG